MPNPASDAQDILAALPTPARLDCVDGLPDTDPFVRKAGQIAVYVNNASLYFEAGDGDDVGDGDGAGWDDSSTALNLKVAIEYFDKGTETIRIGYTTDGATETLATIVTKGNTKTWLKAHLTLSGVKFGTSFYGVDDNDIVGGGGDHYNADLRIFSSGDLYLASVAVKNRDTRAALRFPAFEFQNQTSIVPPDSVVGDEIASATITATNIANATITATQIANATITATQIANATITGANIASGTITATNIQAATITATEIANATITGSKIASATITSGNIAAGTITGGNIASGTITGGNIANLAITAGLIANLTITASQIANLTITGGPSGKIATGTITRDNIVAATITATEIAASTITGSNIAAGTITASNIAAGTITATQLSATAIDAMTITGATIRTASTNPKLELISTQMHGTDSGGADLWKITAAGFEVINTGIVGTATFKLSDGGSNYSYISYYDDTAHGYLWNVVRHSNTEEATYIFDSLGTLSAIDVRALQYFSADTSTTSRPPSVNGRGHIYIKGQKLVIAYQNNSGTKHYFSANLNSTSDQTLVYSASEP